MRVPAPATAIAPVTALLARRTGLVFPEGRQEALAAAVAGALARTGAGSPEELACLLENAPGALDDLVGEITVSESYFFRTPEQFELLRREALPEILRRRGADHRLRLLSAGCASGEEPYSLAILLEEEGLGGRSAVIATDISRPALARAAEANYGEWSLRGSPEGFRARYFRRAGDRWRLDERIRRRVEITYLNLAEDIYPSRTTGIADFDVIFCRNALIYFAPEVVARVAARLYSSLADGGWLFPGPSDPPLGAHAPFDPVMTAAVLVYRRPKDGAVCSPVGASVPIDGPAPVMPSATSLADEPAERPGRLRPPQDENTGLETVLPRVRALADRGRVPEALEAAGAAAQRFPTSAEAHYLRAVLLTEAGRDREAADALRRTLYLDRNLAVAALVLGLALRRLGDLAGAERALRNARALLSARPADEHVPLTDGERAGRLLVAVELQLQLLERAA